MLLIKMADPDLKSDALSDYSVGYTLGSLVVTPILAIAIGRAATVGTASAFVWCALVSLVILRRCLLSTFLQEGKRRHNFYTKRIGDCDETSEWIDCDRVSVLL